jgi:septal ring factor EnvC (AmiA/AmiB activator)
MKRLLALIALAAVLPGARLPAQSAEERLRAQRDSLDRIRHERDSLEARMRALQGQVHTLSDEVTNLRHQEEATARLVKSLDEQIVTLNAEVAETNEKLARAQEEVTERKATLRNRVRDIYKRGPLFAAEALLSARSFGELVARYKYLHELAAYDRAVVQRVETLYKQIDGQRQLLVRLEDEFARNRAEKAREQQRLRDLALQRQRNLNQAQQSAAQLATRLQRIQEDEAKVTSVIAALEKARSGDDARADAPGTSSIRTSDFGKLGWPVEGDILYGFGRAINPNNTAIRWNGVGIAAPKGTPVHTIAAGEVVVADVIGTYGVTVIVQHGGGDYSVYGSLLRAAVRVGSKVGKGDVIGFVGQADPDEVPHLHFEIRPKGRATDPLLWLQQRGP